MGTEIERVALPPAAIQRAVSLAEVRAAMMAAHDRLMACDDVAELAHGADALRALAGDMTTMRRDAEHKAGGLMLADGKRKRLEVEGLGMVERTSDGGTWVDVDYGRAVNDVVSGILRAHEGEVPPVYEFVAELLACFSFAGLKSNGKEGTGLARFGLERESYARQTDRVPTVKVIGGSK